MTPTSHLEDDRAATPSTDEPTEVTEAYLPADTSIDVLELTLPALLQQRATQHPERLALVGVRHSDGAEVRLTYADLLAEAQRAASALRRLAQPGDYVALWAPNLLEWPILMHGAAMAGVVLVALNPVLRAAELDYALAHSGATVLLHADRSRDYDLADVATGLGDRFPDLTVVSLTDTARWRADDVDPAVLASVPTDPDLPVMLQYTSGTTGNPKGVLLRHRSLLNNARLTMEFVGVREGVVTLNPLPMFHTASCVIATLGPLWVGGTEILVHTFVPGPVLQTLRRERVEVLFFVPAVLGALLEVQRTSEEPAPHIEVILGGAAPVPATMIEAAERVFGGLIANVFGQTELAPVLTATRPRDSRSDQLATVGHPLPQVDVKIADPATGQVQPLGVSGEICARGYQQLIEYLHDPVATAAAVDKDGFVHTGDLGSMDHRGYITLTGRLKDLIIRGGENIAPAEIEICLAAHPSVIDATVLGLPDARMGEIVAAIIRLRDQPADLYGSLAAHVRERLSPHKVPTRWFVADELPVTPTGKVQKFKVRTLVEHGGVREIFAAGETVG